MVLNPAPPSIFVEIITHAFPTSSMSSIRCIWYWGMDFSLMVVAIMFHKAHYWMLNEYGCAIIET